MFELKKKKAEVKQISTILLIILLVFSHCNLEALALSPTYFNVSFDANGGSFSEGSMNYSMGSYYDTGYFLDWTKDFQIKGSFIRTEDSVRQLIIGSYSGKSTLNVEIYATNQLRFYVENDFGISSSNAEMGFVPKNEIVNFVVSYDTDSGILTGSIKTKSTEFSDTLSIVPGEMTLSTNSLYVGAKDHRAASNPFYPITIGELSIYSDESIQKNYIPLGNEISETVDADTLIVNGSYSYGSPLKNKIVIENSSIGVLSDETELTRTGYTFDGWYTSPEGGTSINDSTLVTEDSIFYAHWIQNIVDETAAINTTYDGVNHSLQVLSKGAGDGNSLIEPTITYYSDNTYTVTIAEPTYSNVIDTTMVYYEISASGYKSLKSSNTICINALPVNLEWYTDALFTTKYDMAFIYNDMEYYVYAKIKNIFGDTDVQVAEYDATDDNKNTNAGLYKTNVITLGGADSTNYTLTGAVNNEFSWSIDKKVQNFTSSGYNESYDGNAHQITVNVTNPITGITIYYSDIEELTESNYMTSGKIINPSYINAQDEKIVYFYIDAGMNFIAETGNEKITIEKENLNKPLHPVWDDVNESMAKWDNVNPIILGNDSVIYEVQLYKNGELYEEEIKTTNTFYDFIDKLPTTGTDRYTFKVKALTSDLLHININDSMKSEESGYYLGNYQNYYIIGTIEGGTAPYTVYLKNGTSVLSSMITGSEGDFVFEGIDLGIYNLVIEDSSTPMKHMIVKQEVDEQNIVDLYYVMPTEDVNSELNILALTPEVKVNNLNEEAITQVVPGSVVNIILNVQSEIADSSVEQIAINGKSSNTGHEYLEISVEKYVDAALEFLTSTNNVLTIIVPYDFTDKKNISIYRYHGSDVQIFTELSTQPMTPVDETFYVDELNNNIYIFTSNFSQYAIGYDSTSTGTGASTGAGDITDISSILDGDSIEGTSSKQDNSPQTGDRTIPISLVFLCLIAMSIMKILLWEYEEKNGLINKQKNESIKKWKAWIKEGKAKKIRKKIAIVFVCVVVTSCFVKKRLFNKRNRLQELLGW